MHKTILFFLFICNYFFGYSQGITQSIRGSIIDTESKSTLPGANIQAYQDSIFLKGTSTDLEGNFVLEEIPIGRIEIRFSFIGYKEQTLSNIIVTSGKEVILEIELEENVDILNEVVITAFENGEILNDMATVSVRSFSVEETERYAGSRGDPARMASNFAGVQGADDSRNDIVIRGNSPLGVLWRFEGIDIPNPNHFAIAGTTGGPVSIINNKYLNNSDFFTGAFPAEYGNSIAGVFDLNMRKGNNQNYEWSAQIGFLGTEVFAEGPLGKNTDASFLLSYRYSTLKLFDFLNLSIGTQAVPNYQDGAFKLNFPIKKGNISLFSIGGISNIDILVSEYSKEETELYGDSDRDQYFGTSMAVSGISYGHQISKNTFGKLTLAYTFQENHADHALVFRDANFEIDSIVPNLGYYFKDQKISAIYNLNKKVNQQHSFKTGIQIDHYFYDHLDSNLNILKWEFEKRYQFLSSAEYLQGYFQWKYKISEIFIINGGVHAQIFTMNKNSRSLEPRMGMSYQLNKKSSINLGVGMHSQMLPSYQYTFQQQQADQTFLLINKNIGFTKSMHSVLGYNFSISSSLKIASEIYYQYLYQVPIEINASAFSLANEGSGFSRFFPDSLVNLGTGENYGIEITIEKFFSQQFYFLLTGSLYDSKYIGSDGVERKTDFNGSFATNALAGYEYVLNKKDILSCGTKITFAGGKLTTPVDEEATILAKELVFIDSLTNSIKLKKYFRIDLKIAYRMNSEKNNVTHEFALDLVNLFNTQNILGLTYAPNPADPAASPVKEEYQLGFLPLFYYKIDF